MKFYALVTSSLDDGIDFRTFESEDRENAYLDLDDMVSTFESVQLFDRDQLTKFFDAVAKLKANIELEELKDATK
jgi:hypothetical protein